MLAFAYAECGLNVDQFFDLSFYEWSLEIYKVRKRREKENSKWESDANFVREIMALMVNTTPRERGARQMVGSDFIPLSFDKVIDKPKQPLDQKTMKEKLGTKFKKDA